MSSIDRNGKRFEMTGRCPMCGTFMTVHSTLEELTIHKCTGCIHALALTEDYVLVLPSSFAEQIIGSTGAAVCGEVVASDLSSRYAGCKSIDEDYVEMVSQFLRETPDLDPKDVVSFLNIVDDRYEDEKN